MYIEITDEQFNTLNKLWMIMKKFDLEKYVSDKLKVKKETDDVMEKIRVLTWKLWEKFRLVNYQWYVERWTYDNIIISKYGWQIKVSYNWHDKPNIYRTREEAEAAAIPIKEAYRAKNEADKIQNLITSRVSRIEVSILEAFDSWYITEDQYRTLENGGKGKVFVPIIQYLKNENSKDRPR